MHLIKCIRLLCEGNHIYEEISIPSTDPIFSPGTQNTLSTISEMWNMPLILRRDREDLPPDPAYRNLPAKWLMWNPVVRRTPNHWRYAIGPVTVARQDGNDLPINLWRAVILCAVKAKTACKRGGLEESDILTPAYLTRHLTRPSVHLREPLQPPRPALRSLEEVDLTDVIEMDYGADDGLSIECTPRVSIDSTVSINEVDLEGPASVINDMEDNLDEVRLLRTRAAVALVVHGDVSAALISVRQARVALSVWLDPGQEGFHDRYEATKYLNFDIYVEEMRLKYMQRDFASVAERAEEGMDLFFEAAEIPEGEMRVFPGVPQHKLARLMNWKAWSRFRLGDLKGAESDFWSGNSLIDDWNHRELDYGEGEVENRLLETRETPSTAYGTHPEYIGVHPVLGDISHLWASGLVEVSRIREDGTHMRVDYDTHMGQNGTPARQNGTPARQNGTPARQHGIAARQNGTPARQNGIAARQNGTPVRQNGTPVNQEYSSSDDEDLDENDVDIFAMEH